MFYPHFIHSLSTATTYSVYSLVNTRLSRCLLSLTLSAAAVAVFYACHCHFCVTASKIIFSRMKLGGLDY
jgi:hypothetical protein